jgi:O-antigen/teichoic acid export membrane protein
MEKFSKKMTHKNIFKIIKSKKNIATDAMFYAASGLVSFAIQICLLLILTRNLSMNDYGIFVIIHAIIYILLPIIGFGATNAPPIRYFTMERDKIIKYTNTVIYLNIISYIIIIIISYFILDAQILPGGVVYSYILFAAAMAMIHSTALLFSSFYVVLEKPRSYFYSYSAYAATTIGSTLVFCVYFKGGVIGACLGLSLGHAVFLYATHRGIQIKQHFHAWSSQDARDALQFGWPIMMHSIAVALMTYADRLAISNNYGAQAVASYSATMQLSLIGSLFFHSINKVFQPKVLAQLKLQKTANHRYAISLFYIYCSLVIVSSFVMLIIFPIMSNYILYNDYILGPQIYISIIIGGAFNAVYLGCSNFIFFRGKTFKLCLITLFSAVIHLVALYFVLPNQGIHVAAMSYAVANGVMMLLSLYLASTCTNTPWRDRALILLWWKGLRQDSVP